VRRKSDGFVKPVDITGENSRSWLEGPAWLEGQRRRVVKSEYVPATTEEYERQNWRDRNQYRIGQLVANRQPPEVLRKIAELIGYQEEEKP